MLNNITLSVVVSIFINKPCLHTNNFKGYFCNFEKVRWDWMIKSLKFYKKTENGRKIENLDNIFMLLFINTS